MSKTAPSQAARETRRESSSMLAGGASATIWDDSDTVSRARKNLANSTRVPPMYIRGRTLSDLWQNAKTLVFAFCQKMDNLLPTARSPYSVSKTAPSRARPAKNIPAGPDSSGGPPELSETVRMFFGLRLRNAAELLSQQLESFVAGLCQIFGKTRKPRFARVAENPTKSDPRCTSGEHESRAPDSPAREKRDPNRPRCSRVVHPRRSGAIRIPFLARRRIWRSRLVVPRCTAACSLGWNGGVLWGRRRALWGLKGGPGLASCPPKLSGALKKVSGGAIRNPTNRARSLQVA